MLSRGRARFEPGLRSEKLLYETGVDPYDNALCESFFVTLECELLDRRRFKSQAEAKIAVFDLIEGWCNPRCRHSRLGYHSPIRYERELRAETAAAN